MADIKLSDIEQQLGSSTRLRFVDVKSSNVVLFAKEYLKFYDAKGVAVDRRDTEFFWSYEVRNTYARNDPEFDRLLSQVSARMYPTKVCKDEGSRMRGVEQLEQENALLRLEADKLRSKLGRLRK